MKELGFGSAGAAGGGGREMEESEPEEGEAGLGKEEDDCIDPDVDLSYIDTKLEDVLGHLQREFEGGVSLENLGAKFGGYGSFLPTCKRSSSILSQPGSPPKDPGRTVIKSPHGLSCEGPCNDSSIRINAPITKNSPTLTKELDLEGSARKDTSTTATPRNHIEDADLINKGTKGSIQNTLKVCIKVGSDNISDRNNAAIYSGLGLELSPSLSVEDSPEGMKGIHEDGITNVSPRAILQMMSGFPISEGYFLSPLQENLLCLTKAGDRLSGSKSIPEAISILGQLNSPLQSPENCRETAMKLLKENIQIGGNKSKLNDDKVLEKKVNVETPEGQNLSVQASGIPLLLNSGTAESKIMARKTVSKIKEDVVKGIKNTFDQQTESRRMLVKDSTFNSSLSNRNSFESKRNMESDGIVGLKEKAISIKAKPSARLNLTSEDSVEKNKIFRRNALSCKQKECMDKPENDINSNEVEVDGPKVYKNHISGTNEFIKLNNVKKTDNIPEIQGKLKANASYATSVADPPQKPMVSLSSGKEEKKFHARGSVENKSEELKSHKESLHDYPKQSQREVAWEKKGEVVAGRTQHMVTPLIAKNSIRDIKIAKKRPRVKSVDNNSAPSLNFEAPIQTCTDALVYDDSATDAAAAPGPIVIKDSWACCDLCEKWRLLPNGTNPDDLPRKWTCSMQLWLPVGMNHCIVSEDETTNFMNSQCHTSLVENSSIPEYSAPLTSSATVHVDQVNCQIGSIVDRNCSQVRTTSDASMKMQKEKLKVKGKSLKRSSNGVGIVKSKDSKLISKGLINSNISGAKKMIDPDGSHLLNKDAKLGPDFTAKVAPYSANGSSVADLTGKHMREIGDKFLSNSMRDLKGSRSSLNGSVKAHLHTGQKIKQVKVRNARTTDNSVIPGKKRKEREWHDFHNNKKTAMRSQHLGDKRVMHGEDASRSVEKKENKSNACNSVAEQYSMGKMTGAVDKSLKTRLTSRTGKLFIDGMENNKVASVQPSAQGNSSSLRLSSPCLNNANFQESRGSPLDSVFLSPLGAYSSENHSQIRNSVGKSDTKYLGSSAIERSNRCLDGQVNGKMSPLDGPCNDHAKVSLILDGGKTESGIPSEAIAPDHQDKHLIEPFDVKLLQNQDKLNEATGIDEDIANSHFGDRTVISESGVCFRDRNKTSECEFNKGNMKLSNVLSEQEELHSLRNGEQGTPNQGPHFMSSVKTKGSEEFPTCDTVSGLLELASDNKDVARHCNLRREKVHELTGCPMRKAATSNAALVAMKDAKELKHAADRMKNLGQEHEGTALYFQAALKFLQAAFLSEPSSVINIKYDELNESLKTYTQTAALCEFCAREYEKRKDMAFAALAYKCVEVAYFRVAFLKNHAASKDHHELQATMQAFSQDDSPSSSASDIDNQPVAFEKATYSKAVCSLQNTGSHVLTSRSGFTRWLDYTNVSISAFEASRKSQYALSVASASLEKNGCGSIASVEEALNFSFHNVEELLRRIRAAMESFNH